MSGGGVEIATVGHRITHDSPDPPRSVVAVMVQVASGLLQGQGSVIASALGQGLSKMTAELSDGGPQGSCPSPCGAIDKGSQNTFAGQAQLPVALLGQSTAPCDDCDKTTAVVKGSADVWVNTVPVARRIDQLGCGALIGEGELTVVVGVQGTALAIPTPVKDALSFAQQLVTKVSSVCAALERGAALVTETTGKIDTVLQKAESVSESVLGSEISKKLLAGDTKGAVQAVIDGVK